MTTKRSTRPRRTAPTSPRPSVRPTARQASRPWPLIGGGVLLALVVAIGGFVALGGPSALGGSTSPGTADDSQRAAVVQGIGGSWSEITVDELDARLATKDFTLVNVKTPYLGEIDGTDLYIPFDQLAARAAELPVDKTATIVVYCRTGNQSAVAAQTLVDLGYTDIVNVDGGMTAWTASGRSLVQRDRS